MTAQRRDTRETLQAGSKKTLLFVEWTLWLVAGIATLTAIGVWIDASAAQRSAIREIDLARGAVDTSLWSEGRIAKFEKALRDGNANKVVGVLSIPSVDLEVAVFDGTTNHVLDIGVGRVRGTAPIGEKGNLAIAGHRDGFFRTLKDIQVGDDISLRTPESKVRYRVTELFVVDPDDVSVLERSDESVLTLVTCYPFYFLGSAPQRFIVRATALVPDVQPKSNGDHDV